MPVAFCRRREHFLKVLAKFFTYELSSANVIIVGFASTLRATHGAPMTPVAPAASFRKSRRLAFDCVDSAMRLSPYV